MPQIADYLACAVEASRLAGEIQKSGFGRRLQIDFKGPKDPVTDVDRRCEEAIVGMIARAHPDHGIMAEEGSILHTDSPYRWIIDPLDGTTNYSHAYPFFCVSLALEYQGEIILGIVYNPMLDELFSAVKGEGAWLNGNPIRVSGTGTLERALLATGRLAQKKAALNTLFDQYKRLTISAQGTRRDGSAALDLCYVANGRFDGFWEFGLKPWDTAAGSIIVTEAGGRITTFTGQPFDPFGSEVLASNGILHAIILNILNDNSTLSNGNGIPR